MSVGSLKDIQVFTGVMDGDSEKRFIKPGDYLFLINGRVVVTNDSNNGGVEDAEGNLLIPNQYIDLYGGRSRCIGSYEDVPGQSIIFLVWNSLGHHGIYRWFYAKQGYVNGVIEKIWQVKDPSIYDDFNPNPLNFDEFKLVTGCALFDNIFVWTDFNGDPKQIDVSRANETNKKRKFDFFVNQSALNENITYTFTLQSETGQIVGSVQATSSNGTLTGRIKDIFGQLSALQNIGFFVYNKIDKIELEVNQPGEFLITVSDNGSEGSKILANNFYYSDIPGNFFFRIQPPPFCRPNAYFDPVGPPTEQNQVRGLYQIAQDLVMGNIFGTSPTKMFFVPGIGVEQNDFINNIIIGPSTSYLINYNANPFSPLNYNFVQSWVRTSNGSLTLRYGFSLDVVYNEIEDTNANPPITAPAELFAYLIKISPSGAYTILNATNIPIPPYIPFGNNTFSYSFVSPPINVIAPSSDKIFLAFIGRAVLVDLSGASISLGSADAILAENVVLKQTNMFRAKYIYENNQHSVYGQSTSVVLRTEAYNQQNKVKILYNDKFLSSKDFLSKINEIVFSFSKDGGVSWYEFDRLKKWQFACASDRWLYFDNKKTEFPIPTQEAILQFHAVPLKSKSLERADNRIIEGGIIEGYDPITIDIDITYLVEDYKENIYYSSGQIPISIEGFKPGYRGYIGIVYYDDFDRKSPVCLSVKSKVEFPYYPTPYSTGDLVTSKCPVWYISVNVFNEPPSWATKYRLVRTKDFSQSSYLMWIINSFEIIDANGSTSGTPYYYKINLDNLAFYTEKSRRGAVIEYTYEKGDRVILIADKNGVLFTKPYDVEIASADANNIYIKYDLLLPIDEGVLIEIYSKASEQSAEDSLFYEMGECFEIKTAEFGGIKRKYHTGNNFAETGIDQTYGPYGTQNPAKLISFHGGAYNRIRPLWFLNPPATGNPNTQRLYWIQSNYADEFDQSKEDGLTRPNTVSVLGQTKIDDAVRFSNTYISGTDINGLNANEPLNIVRFDSNYGLLNKLILINNNVVRAIFNNGYQVSLYISQGIIKQLQGEDSLISVTDNVVSNSYIIQRTLGTQNAESIALNDQANLIGFDQNEGVVWSTNQNGIIAISDYKQKTFFKNQAEKRRLLDRDKISCPSVYDVFRNEYIITLGAGSSKKEKLPFIKLSLFSPGEFNLSYIKLFVEETGEIIFEYNPNNNLNQAGININLFIAQTLSTIKGWQYVVNFDGSITVFASDQSYNDKTITINYITASIQLGTELVANGAFIPPNNGYWNGGNGWAINPAPGWPYAEYNGNPTIGELTQEVFGLNSGKDFILEYAVETFGGVGSIRPILGSGPTETIGPATNVTTPPFANPNAVKESHVLSFNNPNNILRFVPDQFWNGRITDVSLKEILSNNFTIRLKMTGGEPAQEAKSVEAVTIAFSSKRDGWTQFHSFTPEMYGRLNDSIVSFKDGKMWLHTTQAIPKNYFGVQYARELQIVSNKDFPKVKEYKAININGFGKNTCPAIIIPPYEGVPTGMETELTLAHFSTKEGIQYAAIQKDKLTPGFLDQVRAWVNGRSMKGQVIIIPIVNNEPVVSLIYSTEILYFYSENS